ncbi:MAG: hypothetical protein SV253_01365 [Halobacteria archaeon]|nr:hypothetical protein [Halobacteria archaeon]
MSIRIRDATEEDAERIAEIASEEILDEKPSADSVRDMVHDRTLRVAETQDGIRGYVSYDVELGSDYEYEYEYVVIHQIGVDDSDNESVSLLLDEPLAAAEEADLGVRIAVDESDESLREALEERGFTVAETRRFRGEKTVVYQTTPTSTS